MALPQVHRRWYKIAGVGIELVMDLPITSASFRAVFEPFRVSGPCEDTISIHHHFSYDGIDLDRLGVRVCRTPPWEVFRNDRSWIYHAIGSGEENAPLGVYAVFNPGHTRGEFHHPVPEAFLPGNWYSLTLLPTDAIILIPVLADRRGCFVHASGVIWNGMGFLFIGHSGAGKSTLTRLLGDEVEVLSDDRVILRRWPEGFRVHGTWIHGEIPQVSPSDAPLRAIFLLEKAPENRIEPLSPLEVSRTLPLYLIKPILTAEWWPKALDLTAAVAREVPVYRLAFQPDSRIRDLLRPLAAEGRPPA